MSLPVLHQKKRESAPISMLAVYEAGFARLAHRAGVDAFLVGDSLGMVVQGNRDTLGVTVDDIAYHAQQVRRGAPDAFVIADVPFLADADVPTALQTARVLMQQGQADMIKIEGGAEKATLIEALVQVGIPVCGHIGLLPQLVRRDGGYRVHGREQQEYEQVINNAKAVEKAGAAVVVIECVPAALGRAVSHALQVPVIGIGAGCDVDGQVLVMHDLLGMTEKPPRFARDFLVGQSSIENAFRAYVQAVKERSFPADDEMFS